MKIGILTADWGRVRGPDGQPKLVYGGSSWNRMHMPFQELAKHGHSVTVSEGVALGDSGPILIDWKTKLKVTGFDVLVIQRVMNDYCADVIENAHKHGVPVVQDVDDWYWGLHKDNNAYKATDPKLHPDCNRDLYKENLKISDLVLVTTNFLEEKMKEMHDNVVVVKNSIDMERWPAVPIREKPIVGWVGATSHRSGDLETLQGIVAPFLERRDLKFHHGGWLFGTKHAVELMGIDPKRSTTSPLCPIEQYPQHFGFMDISLVPLNPIPFNHAKSWLKGIESAATGTPFIAQALPEYKELRDEYGIGRVAKKGNQWRNHLEELMDPRVRLEEATVQRERLKELDITIKYKDWERALQSLL